MLWDKINILNILSKEAFQLSIATSTNETLGNNIPIPV